MTPAAEFNIYADPHAARVVMESGLPITLLGLDVTHQVLTTPARLSAFERLGTPVGQAVADLLRYYGQAEVERYGLPGAPFTTPV